MRARLVAIALAIALAVLACVAMGYDRQAPPPASPGNAASGQLAGPPAPAPDVPAMTAAGSTSATFQSVLVIDSRAPLGPVLSVSTLTLHTAVAARSTGKPLVFPLLI